MLAGKLIYSSNDDYLQHQQLASCLLQSKLDHGLYSVGSNSSGYLSPVTALAELVSSTEPEDFKLTEDIIITALNNYLLEDFIVSHDNLSVHETLGEGEIRKSLYYNYNKG